MRQYKNSRLVGLVFSLILLSAVAVGFWQRQAIFDWWRLRGYEPSATVAQLATDTTMTPSAQHLFYVFRPELNDKSSFRSYCTEWAEATVVLGCYVTNRGIYLYDVQDPRLQGVKQTTAAHEMLHVAYQRLSADERRRINALLEEAYKNVTDTRIRATIDAYKKNGDDAVNELHSILATEVATLPPELEAYYKRYFSDRSKLVGYYLAYEDEFTSRQQKVEQYDAQLEALEARVTSNKASLEYQAQQLDTERVQLDNYLAAGNYQAYNAGVINFNNQVRQYNALADATRADIASYNSIATERNQVALEHHDLTSALDSRLESEAVQP